jgi:hypothetical protein
MPRHDLVTRTSTRCLSFAILGLQLAAGAAVAHAQLARPLTPRTTTNAALQADIEIWPAALPVIAAEVTTPPTTSPARAATRPAPEPAPAPVRVDAPPRDPMDRVEAMYQVAVPAEWRSAIPVHFQLIDGNTSYASHDGTIQISSVHANGSDSLLRATITHELGHIVAFWYGSQAFNGAAPEGWPSYSDAPQEAWADCVSRALTDLDAPSHDLPSCEGDSLSWTAAWMARGPAAHPRKGT